MAKGRGQITEPTDAHVFTRIELDERLTAACGKTLGEVDSAGVFEHYAGNKKVTGIAGHVIEKSVLGYEWDSRREADLLVDGVETELKTTGVRKRKGGGGLEAKEPMSITAVGLETISSEQFETSHFWRKLEHLLLVYYHYNSEHAVSAGEYARFPIVGFDFHEFSDSEKEALKNDWSTVRDFIAAIEAEHTTKEEREEKYPWLSSALREELMLIDTAPKYRRGKSGHNPRFRLKRATVNAMVQQCLGGKFESLRESYSSYAALDAKCHELAERYRGMTVRELMEELRISHPKSTHKGMGEQIAVAMFGGESKKISKIKQFAEAGIIGKTVVLTEEGKRTEDMKLLRVHFDEFTAEHPLEVVDDDGVIETGYEASELYHYLSQNQLLCIIFSEPSDAKRFDDNIFAGFKRFPFLENLYYEDARQTWEQVRHLVVNREVEVKPVLNKEGKPIFNKNGRIRQATNFPKSRDHVVFLRGTGTDSADKREEVCGVRMLRQNYWLKGAYLAEKLAEMPFL